MMDSGPWLNPKIVNRTLEEGAQCRRKNIPITTFMVTDDPTLVSFVEDLTKINHGRRVLYVAGETRAVPAGRLHQEPQAQCALRPLRPYPYFENLDGNLEPILEPNLEP